MQACVSSREGTGPSRMVSHIYDPVRDQTEASMYTYFASQCCGVLRRCRLRQAGTLYPRQSLSAFHTGYSAMQVEPFSVLWPLQRVWRSVCVVATHSLSSLRVIKKRERRIARIEVSTGFPDGPLMGGVEREGLILVSLGAAEGPQSEAESTSSA